MRASLWIGVAVLHPIAPLYRIYCGMSVCTGLSSGAQPYHMACDGGMVVGYRYLCAVWRYCALFGLVRSLLVRAFAYAAMAVVDDRTRELSMGGTDGVYADSQSLCLLGCTICNRYPERPDNSRMANVADVCLGKKY